MQRVREVRVGLGYTAALLDDERCGLAYTFREDAGEGCSALREAGGIAGRRTSELIPWAQCSDPISAAVGLAVVNALADTPGDATWSDLLPLLHGEAGDVVGTIGLFGPLIEPLRARIRQLLVFKRHPDRCPGTLPETAAQERLTECQIVNLSATTLLHRTIDDLLVHALSHGM